MELWIRSQDKRKLIPIKEKLYIPYSRTGEDFGIFYKDNILAHFKKEKRTMEVLDEIQEAQLGNYHYRCPSNVKVSNKENTIVYEMPEE